MISRLLSLLLALTFGVSSIPLQSFAEESAAPEMPAGQDPLNAKEESPEIIEQPESAPARALRIDLQRVKGASFYEIMVVPAAKIWSEPMRFVVGNDYPRVRLRLSPGEYAVRTRSLDNNKNPGRWSDYQKFWVNFRPVLLAFPKDGDEIEPRGEETESIIFEWPKVKSANFYFFKLRDSEGHTLRSAITHATWFRSEVKINSKYSWMVVPLASKEQYKAIISKPSLGPYRSFKVLAPNEEARGTMVKIKPDIKALKYEIEVVSVNRADSTSGPSIIETKDPNYRFRLPPGEYEMRARSVHKDQSVTEWSAPSKFFIRRFAPVIDGPSPKAEIDSTDDQSNKILLKWKADKNAENYRVYVYNSKNELIFSKITKETSLMTELPHNEKYKWLVKAYSAREIASEPNPEEATSTFSIDKYIPLSMTSAEEPSQLYAWAKQMSSVEDYKSDNWDNNSIVRQKLVGGEAETAVGYWWRKTKFGVLAHTSLAGFLFRGKNYLYSNYGLHFGYRYLLSNGDRLRFWLGIAQRESPEVITNPFTSAVDFNKIKSVGPQLQVAYLHSFNDKKGIQFSGGTYYSQTDRGTPNGMPQVPVLSYRASIMGTYFWDQQIRLMGGYTYRIDQAAYQSADTPGKNNTSVISGHYLSFMAEIALQEKMK